LDRLLNSAARPDDSIAAAPPHLPRLDLLVLSHGSKPPRHFPYSQKYLYFAVLSITFAGSPLPRQLSISDNLAGSLQLTWGYGNINRKWGLSGK
jgi:hypothetical protein